jgi:hypothetical protein
MPVRALVAVTAVGVALSGCAGSSQSATIVSLPAAAPREASLSLTARAPAPTHVDRVLPIGKAQYAREVSGAKVRSLLHRVAADRGLLKALATSDSAARAYVAQQFPNTWYHWHISRLRIVRGAKVVTERGVPFVVNGPRMKLRGAGGRDLGTLQVSLQDEIGFVRLMHRNHAVHVVVRGTGLANVRSSLPAATHAALPVSGMVKVTGHKYAVRSFKATAWNDEPVTIWLLAAA